MIAFDTIPSIVARIHDAYPPTVSLDQWLAPSQWTEETMSEPTFHPPYFPELLDDEEAVIPRRRAQFGFYDEQWRAYGAAGQPYGYCNDGMMEWLCEQRGIVTKAWFHVL